MEDIVFICKDSSKPVEAARFRCCDPLHPPFFVKMAIHYEIPVYVWASHASQNVLIVEPSTFNDNWKPYLTHFDLLLFKTQDHMDSFLISSDKPKKLWGTDVLEELVLTVKGKQGKHEKSPILSEEEIPSISIITLIHNRRNFIDLAFHNLLSTYYPKDKIEWVVVDDSDIIEEQASDKIIKFGIAASPINLTYVPLDTKMTIGEKRNLGVKRAMHEIILMMDDDDHYPPTSFMRRVAWLLKHQWKPQAVSCTTIACYDLMHGTSSVSTPDLSIPLSQRISEATLTFRKSWWEQRAFPSVNMAEGEEFVKGREEEFLELPPQQIIVAMTHNKNTSGRKGIEGTPSCYWGFPKEFLQFLHKLVDVEILS